MNALSATLALAGCLAAPEPPQPVHVRLVVNSTESPAAQAPDLASRVDRVVAITAERFGVPSFRLLSSTVRISYDWVDCGAVVALGCYDPAHNVMDIATSPYTCIEATALAHEVLHVAIPDTDHRDPVWRDTAAWQALWDEIRAPDCVLGPAWL